MSQLTFKPGDTFAYACQLADDATGVPFNLTGYTLQADICEANPDGTPGTKLADLTVAIPEPTTGAFTLRHGITDSWPLNATLLLDVLVLAPDASRTRLPTVRVVTVPGVTT